MFFFLFSSSVLDCFHSHKQLFKKVLILSMLQNSAFSQVNQGCTDVLLKENLMKVAQCLAAHTCLLNSQSTFSQSLFDDKSVSVICLAFVKGGSLQSVFYILLFSPALMQLDTRSRLFKFLAHGLVSRQWDFIQWYLICRNLHLNSCSLFFCSYLT